MKTDTVSMREMQRNYSKIIKRAQTSRSPIFLGSRGKIKAVLLDIVGFERLTSNARKNRKKMQWNTMRRTLDRIAAAGRQDVTLSDFIVHDRKAH